MELGSTDLEKVAEQMTAAGEPIVGELRGSLLTGGRSNLTYVLADEVTRWVMRTPPRVGRTPSAHDMGREFRVTDALSRTAVPVARQVLSCEDETVLGVPFTVADFVDGAAIRSQHDLGAVDDGALAAVLDSMLSALGSLHQVEPEAIGLADFGRPGGYARRQLRRWSGQWELVGLPACEAEAQWLIDRLGAALPEQRFSRVVHGDFRIDNTIVALQATTPHVAAVVDWELSTIGDPVADVAMMCAYRDPAFDLIVGEPSAWTSERLPSVDELAERYLAAGGVELDNWSFHLALAYFKVGVIAAGIDHRRRAGSGSGAGFDTAGQSVALYFDLAHSVLATTATSVS